MEEREALRLLDFLNFCETSPRVKTSFDDGDIKVLARYSNTDKLDFKKMMKHFAAFTEMLSQVNDEVIALDQRVSYLDVANYFKFNGHVSLYHAMVNDRYVYYSVPKGPARTTPPIFSLSQDQIELLKWKLNLDVEFEYFERSVRHIENRLPSYFYPIIIIYLAYSHAIKDIFTIIKVVGKLMAEARHDIDFLVPCSMSTHQRLHLVMAGGMMYDRTGNKMFLENAISDVDLGLRAIITDESLVNNQRPIREMLEVLQANLTSTHYRSVFNKTLLNFMHMVF